MVRTQRRAAINVHCCVMAKLGFRLRSLVIRKWLLSFLKREWTLRDYPVRIKAQEFDPTLEGSRYTQSPYWAIIVNWGLTAGGEDKNDAIRNLEVALATVSEKRRREGRHMPRPGTSVPVEFASQDEVLRHPELMDDFVVRVLELEWALISDESSLWDFHSAKDNSHYIAKIQEVYGVDVSDIESAKLYLILDRIAESQAAKQPE